MRRRVRQGAEVADRACSGADRPASRASPRTPAQQLLLPRALRLDKREDLVGQRRKGLLLAVEVGDALSQLSLQEHLLSLWIKLH